MLLDTHACENFLIVSCYCIFYYKSNLNRIIFNTLNMHRVLVTYCYIHVPSVRIYINIILPFSFPQVYAKKSSLLVLKLFTKISYLFNMIGLQRFGFAAFLFFFITAS